MALRLFAYLFVRARTVKLFGFASRLLTPAVLLLYASIGFAGRGGLFSSLVLLALQITLAAALLGPRRAASMLSFLGFIALLGVAFTFLGIVLGYPAPEPVAVVTSTVRIVVALGSVSMFFQLVSTGELYYMLRRMGLRDTATIIALAFAYLPNTLAMFSEASAAALLKYGRRGLLSAVKSLIVDAAISSFAVAEAVYLYGVPEKKPILYRGLHDAVLITSVSLIPLPLVIAGL